MATKMNVMVYSGTLPLLVLVAALAGMCTDVRKETEVRRNRFDIVYSPYAGYSRLAMPLSPLLEMLSSRSHGWHRVRYLSSLVVQT